MGCNKMFKNLLNFEYKRSGKEALGFYLAFLLLNMVVGATLGGIFEQGGSFSSGYTIGVYGAIILQLIIGILILSKRKRYKKLLYIVLVLLSVLLSKLGGGLLGLIPLAYLATQ